MRKSYFHAALGTLCLALSITMTACGGGGGDAATAELGNPPGGGGTGGTGGGGVPSAPLEISNTTPTDYVWSDLAIGMPAYVDRAYTLTSVPSAAQGLPYLQTANDDKSVSNPSAIQFSVNQSVTVFVAYDARSATVPSWLQSWADAGMTLSTNDTSFDVYQRDFAAGSVTLGGNDSANSMYLVAVMPQDGVQAGPLAISGSPTQSVTEGTNYRFVPSVSGGAGNRTLSIVNKPSWAGFDESSGVLTGTPGVGDIGMTTSGIVISATDGNETVSLPAFEISVLASANGSATLSWTAPTLNSDNTPLTDLAGYKIHYGTSPGNYPNSKRIDNPGITTSMVENLAPGTWSFVVTAFDFAGNESGYSNIASKTISSP